MLESSGEILGANWGEVILDRKHFNFLVQVIDRGHPTQPVSMWKAKFWKFWSFRIRVGEPNGNFKHEKELDKGNIGDKYGFLLLTLVGTSKGMIILR